MIRVIAYQFTFSPSKKYFQSTVAAKTESDCPVCLDELKDPVTTKCNHEFCFVCIINLKDYICPLCRENLRVKYSNITLNKTDLECFRKALGYVLPNNSKEEALDKLSFVIENTYKKMRIQNLIEMFFEKMSKDFVIIN